MKQYVYAIKDDVSGVWHPPFVDWTHEAVERSFKDAALSGKVAHYTDLTVYCIGEWHDGHLKSYESADVSMVLRGSSLVPSVE